MKDETEEIKLQNETQVKVNKREKRVGTYTFGAMLILIGISVIIMTFTSLDLLKYILMLWPVLLIGLGIEILYLNSKSDVKVKIDFISIILMCIVLFFTAIFSVGNYFVNKVLYDNDVKSIIVNECVNNTYYRMLNGKVTINANDNKNIKVKFKENPTYENSSEVEIKVKYDTSKENNLFKIFNYRDEISEKIINFNESTVNIEKLPDYIESIEIIVHTTDKNNIIYNGEIEI